MSPRRPAPDLLTFAEVAERVGGAAGTVRKWVDRGPIPVAAVEFYRSGTRRWVRWADVRAFGELHCLGKDRPAWLEDQTAG